MSTFALTGRTVLVTGAASGIGAASALALIAAGANVALVDLHQTAVDKLAAELGPNAFPVAGDVTDLPTMQAVAAKVQPEVIAKAVVRGIEQRSARVMAPKRWVPLSIGRGIIAILGDAVLDRHQRMQELIRQIETPTAQQAPSRSSVTTDVLTPAAR